MSKYTTLQNHVHEALFGGVSPAMNNYLLSKNWGEDDIRKLAFSLTFFGRAFRSKTSTENESNLQNLVSTLTMHKGIKSTIPGLGSIFRDPKIAEFLQDKNSVQRVANEAFDSYEYKTFKYKVSNPSVPIWDLGGIDSKVKHICPSGVVIHFQKEISYLITKSYRQIKMFFGDPSDYKKKSRRTDIRDLQIKCGNDEVSVWDKITVKSVAMIPRKDGEDYTYSDRIAYVELKFEDQGIEHAFRSVGGEGNLKVATKSNLRHYVPKSHWEKFDNNIDAAKHVFGKKNKEILNNGSEEKKTKSRDALEKLTMYYKSLKDTPDIDFVEPQETRARVASSNRATSENTDEDDRMSIISEEL